MTSDTQTPLFKARYAAALDVWTALDRRHFLTMCIFLWHQKVPRGQWQYIDFWGAGYENQLIEEVLQATYRALGQFCSALTQSARIMKGGSEVERSSDQNSH